MLEKIKKFKASNPAIYLVALWLIILSGCATKEAVRSDRTSVGVLKERAVTYCGYLVSREYDKMYPMEYPLYRKNVSLVQYIQHIANPAVKFGKCDVSDITVDHDQAKVNLNVTLDLKVPGAKVFEYDRRMSDKWVLVDGEWYHVLGGVKTPAYENK